MAEERNGLAYDAAQAREHNLSYGKWRLGVEAEKARLHPRARDVIRLEEERHRLKAELSQIKQDTELASALQKSLGEITGQIRAYKTEMGIMVEP